MEIVFALGACLLVGLTAALTLRDRHSRNELLQEAADSLGLEQQPDGSWHKSTGRAGTVVKVEMRQQTSLEVRVWIASGPPIPPEVGLHRRREGGVAWELPGESTGWRATGPTIPGTYEETFPGGLRIHGPARQVLALLDEETRPLLLDGMPGFDLVLRHGTLVSIAKGRTVDVLGLRIQVQRMIRLAEALSLNPAAIPVRLAQLVGTGSAQTRRNCLQELCRSYPSHPETPKAARRALADPEAQVRLVASVHLQEVGLAELRELALGGQEPEVRCAALEELARLLPPAEFEPLLLAALQPAPPAVSRCAAALAGRSQIAAATPRLVALLRSADSLTAVTAADALAEMGRELAEEALVAALGRPEAQVRLAIVRALGAVGGPAALRALSPHQGRELLALPAEWAFSNAVREAMLAIRARLGPLDAGGLSMANPVAEDRGLSLASDAGGLSHPGQEPGLGPTGAQDERQ